MNVFFNGPSLLTLEKRKLAAFIFALTLTNYLKKSNQ